MCYITIIMAAVDFVTNYITNYVDGMVRPYVEQGAAAVGDVAGGVMFSVGALPTSDTTLKVLQP